MADNKLIDDQPNVADESSSTNSSPVDVENNDQNGESSSESMDGHKSEEEDVTEEGEAAESNDDEEKILLQQRLDREEQMSTEEKKRLRDQAQSLKNSGNDKFKEQCYADSIVDYTEALSLCPLCFNKERSIMYSNRAAAQDHLNETDLVIKDCTSSIELDPCYIKPILRRAQAYEKADNLDEALTDYKTLFDMGHRPAEVVSACQRLPKQIEEKAEKMKTEMLGKLKEVGNLFLRPFGLSTDNFNLQQNESGGYSVNFTNS